MKKSNFHNPTFYWILVSGLVGLLIWNLYDIVTRSKLTTALNAIILGALLTLIFTRHEYAKNGIKFWAILGLIAGPGLWLFARLLKDFRNSFTQVDLQHYLPMGVTIFIGVTIVNYTNKTVRIVPVTEEKKFSHSQSVLKPFLAKMVGAINFVNKPGLIHIAILFFLIFGLDLTLRLLNRYSSAFTFFLIPCIYAIVYLSKSISLLIRKHYYEAALLVLCFFLILVIPFKISFTYYNSYFAFLLTGFSIYFLKTNSVKFKSDKLRTIFTFLIAFNLVCLFIPNTSILAYLNLNYLKWTPNLDWKAFQGSPEQNQAYSASIDTDIKYQVNKVYNYPAASLISIMNPNNSYVREQPQNIDPVLRNIAYKYLLQHEQTHFNITEFYVQEANRKVTATWILNDADALKFVEQAMEENQKMHRLYDSLTDHGKDTLQQSKWTRDFKNRLDLK